MEHAPVILILSFWGDAAESYVMRHVPLEREHVPVVLECTCEKRTAWVSLAKDTRVFEMTHLEPLESILCF